MASAAQSDEHFQEWTQARLVISAADTNLDSIRKLGISLVTALLTANAFLLPGEVGGTSALPDPAKFGVLLATLLLLAAVAVIDRNYLVLQEAAASRAMVLETELDLELTWVIAERYAEKGVKLTFHLVYVVIGAATVGLGYFVLDPSIYFYALVGVWVGYSILTLLISVDFRLHGGTDWSLDKIEVTQHDLVRLTITNLHAQASPLRLTIDRSYDSRHSLVLAPFHRYWELRPEPGLTAAPQTEPERPQTSSDHDGTERHAVNQESENPVLSGFVSHRVTIGPGQNFVWVIDCRRLPAGHALCVFPYEPARRRWFHRRGSPAPAWDRWPQPLRRKIMVNLLG